MAKINVQQDINGDNEKPVYSKDLSFDYTTGLVEIKSLLDAYSKMSEEMQKGFNLAEKAAQAAASAMEQAATDVNNMKSAATIAKNNHTAKQTALKNEREKAVASNDTELVKKLDLMIKQDQINYKKEELARKKEEENQKKLLNKEAVDLGLGQLKEDLTSGDGLKGALKSYTENVYGISTESLNVKDKLKLAATGISDVAMNFREQIDGVIKTISGYKMAWDTRLDGSSKSHFTINELVKTAVGVSPFIKQTDVFTKLNQAIDNGIAYNVEYRSYLDVMSDNIATTFEAFNSTLDEIIRIQQEDSTAYRLGMEASLNEYLNRMFENSQYLNDVSDGVTSALYQATSLLNSEQSIAFEFQAQKWLGSLYSVGMGSTAISGIAQAIGALASGNMDATETGAGKLLVMAASNAGLDYAQMLTDGLDGSELNILMQSMVFYLQQIASENRVVQNEMANLFGLATADIQAAGNLTGQVMNIYNTAADYNKDTAYNKLDQRLDTMYLRTSIVGAMQNVTDNLMYTLAGSLGSNPALYMMYTLSNIMSDMDTEIAIPAVSVMGNSVDLETTVADLMRAGAISGSLLSSVGGLFSGLGQIVAGPQVMQGLFQATSKDGIRIGSGFGYSPNASESALSVTYVGNQSGDDIIDQQNQQQEQQKAEAADGAEDDSKDMNDL